MRYYVKQQTVRRELRLYKKLIAVNTAGFPLDVQAAVEYVHDRLFDNSLTVSAMVQDCGLRNHNFSGRFIHFMGMSPRDYIEDRRMMAAMHLLWYQEIEIYVIAFAIGYTHHESFSRAFKRWIGCSPSTCRNRLIGYRRRVRSKATRQARNHAKAGRTYGRQLELSYPSDRPNGTSYAA